jgi:hypothetical protein
MSCSSLFSLSRSRSRPSILRKSSNAVAVFDVDEVVVEAGV